MKVACGQCGAKYDLQGAENSARSKVQFTCPKCGHKTIVETKQLPSATVVMRPLPSFARANAQSSENKVERAESRPRLPKSICAALSVTEGPDAGKIFNLEFADIIVGRQGADVALNDPEISRQHCQLEIRETFIQLKDLDSTNGTYFDEERVRAAMLRDGTEFRVGTTTLKVSLTPKL